MSQSPCNKLWTKAQEQLRYLLAEERRLQALPPECSRRAFLQQLNTLFALYVRLFQQLEEVDDQMVHAQKRRLVRETLEGVMGRLLELKDAMTAADACEFHPVDNALQDLKLTPADLEIPVPRYFLGERGAEMQQRTSMLGSAVGQEGCDDDRTALEAQKGVEPLAQQVAGLHYSSSLPVSASAIQVAENDVRRRQLREQNEALYQEAVTASARALQDSELRFRKEELKDQIRQWIVEYRDTTGTLPDYPGEEEGGSALIFDDGIPRHEQEQMGSREEPDVGPPKSSEDDSEGSGFKLPPSLFLPGLEASEKTFARFWENQDLPDIPTQRHNMELIVEERRKEVEEEARREVDESMRVELSNLKRAMGIDEGRRQAKGKAKGTKGKKGRKKDKDLTSDRSLESLYQELAEQGLLKQADAVKLRDYLGSLCYMGTTLQQMGAVWTATAADVRQLITLSAIIPLGSPVINEKGLAAKTILLVGPTGTGKRMLVHAICQETGANLFDLSPLNLANKYPGKRGLQMMLHMVFKVAKLMQPSVIYIGGAEMMFYKKVPKKNKKANPKRLTKVLPKFLKQVVDDRVLVVGTSSDPAKADLQSLLKMYAKVFLLPRPDHNSRHLLWSRFIEQAGGEVTPALNVSALARHSDGCTAGQISQMVREVLTETRLQQLPAKPLVVAEFTPSLTRVKPVTQAEEELRDWFAKTPQGQAQMEAATAPDLAEATPDSTDDKSGKKPKAK